MPGSNHLRFSAAESNRCLSNPRPLSAKVLRFLFRGCQSKQGNNQTTPNKNLTLLLTGKVGYAKAFSFEATSPLLG